MCDKHCHQENLFFMDDFHFSVPSGCFLIVCSFISASAGVRLLMSVCKYFQKNELDFDAKML